MGVSFPVGGVSGWTDYNNANYWNVTKQAGVNIYNSSNPYIAGNFYTVSSHSATCTDADTDGFCDSAFDLYNLIECSGGSCSMNTDYKPISDEYVPPAGEPDINISFGPPSTTLFRFIGCGPAISNSSSWPENQTTTYGIDYLCNNGTGSGDLQEKYTGSPNTGWSNFYVAVNSGFSPQVLLTTSFQTIYSGLGADQCTYVWHKASCVNVVARPGIDFEYQIV
jgi:hypothetical protein